ncbi:MAG TPA: acyl-CoA thioesterase [Actinomycetota bacterium]|nr:acyl-CoA thioesterase [Actinomycetota bacterium]
MAGRELEPKPVSASHVTLVQLMEITDANIAGIVHGGTIMKLVDTAAGLAAMKHCGGPAVTVSMDTMSFLAPVRIGDTVTVRASVNDVGRTSLEVGVRVESENVLSGERTHTGSAYLVFVALDEQGKPRPVPSVIAQGQSQRRRQKEAKIRRQTRLAHKQAIQEHRDEVRGEQVVAPPNEDEPQDDEGFARRSHLRM